MTILVTVLRGLGSRATLFVGTLVLLIVSIGATVLGPMFQEAVVGSYTVTRIAEAPDTQTALTWEATSSGTDRSVPDLVQAATAVVSATMPDEYAEPEVTLLSQPNPSGPVMTYVARDSACELLAVDGACPTTPDQVAINEVDLGSRQVGDTFRSPELGTLRIVGTYTTPTDAEDWLLPSRLASIPASQLSDRTARAPTRHR